MTTEEKLLVWKALTGHLIAILLIVGLFAIILLALVGVVKISDPTTATFVGTATGYIVSQLTRPLTYYFFVSRDSVSSDKSNETR